MSFEEGEFDKSLKLKGFTTNGEILGGCKSMRLCMPWHTIYSKRQVFFIFENANPAQFGPHGGNYF
ncbi:MAG: hypothetical protein QNK92_04715 [Amylibacter sp.]